MAYALILALTAATALMFYAIYTRIRHLEGLLTAHLDLHDTKERQYEANSPTSTQVRSLEGRVRDLDAALRLGTTDPTGAHGYAEPRGYLEGNVQAWKRAYDEQQQKRLEAAKDA